jgi:hypothetical protein
MLQPIASRPSIPPPKSPANRLIEFGVPERAFIVPYNKTMSADTTRFAAPGPRNAQDSRRAKVAPLLAAGLSVRAISAETGIPVGAVHRAKRQLEKTVAQGGQKAAAIPLEPPLSCVVKQDINGVQHDVRRLTVSVFEQAVESAIGRRLLGRGDRAEPWTVVSALFASMFDNHTMEWLNKRGYLRWDQHGQGEAIISAVNALIAHHR